MTTLQEESFYGKHPFLLAKAFAIKSLKRRRKIWAFLPSDYFTNTDRRYPVIYLNDGQNIFEGWKAPFGKSWEIHLTMRQLHTQFGIGECILIGIEHGKRKRLTEYNPNHIDGNLYSDCLANDIKNFVDKKLRTLPQREFNIVAGSSLGGLSALYTAFKHQDVFRYAGLFSPSIWMAPQLLQLIPKVGRHFDTYFYISVGQLEGKQTISNAKSLHDTLLQANFKSHQLYFKSVPKGRHDELLWQNEFKEFYFWISQHMPNYYP